MKIIKSFEDFVKNINEERTKKINELKVRTTIFKIVNFVFKEKLK